MPATADPTDLPISSGEIARDRQEANNGVSYSNKMKKLAMAMKVAFVGRRNFEGTSEGAQKGWESRKGGLGESKEHSEASSTFKKAVENKEASVNKNEPAKHLRVQGAGMRAGGSNPIEHAMHRKHQLEQAEIHKRIAEEHAEKAMSEQRMRKQEADEKLHKYDPDSKNMASNDDPYVDLNKQEQYPNQTEASKSGLKEKDLTLATSGGLKQRPMIEQVKGRPTGQNTAAGDLNPFRAKVALMSAVIGVLKQKKFTSPTIALIPVKDSSPNPVIGMTDGTAPDVNNAPVKTEEQQAAPQDQIPSAPPDPTGMVFEPTKKSFTPEEAKKIGDVIKIDWNKTNPDEFRIGLAVEMEHAGHEHAVCSNYEDVANIVWVHLNQLANYYTKLEEMLADSKAPVAMSAEPIPEAKPRTDPHPFNRGFELKDGAKEFNEAY